MGKETIFYYYFVFFCKLPQDLEVKTEVFQMQLEEFPGNATPQLEDTSITAQPAGQLWFSHYFTAKPVSSV